MITHDLRINMHKGLLSLALLAPIGLLGCSHPQQNKIGREVQAVHSSSAGILDFLKKHDSDHVYAVDAQFTQSPPPGNDSFITLSGIKSTLAVANVFQPAGGFVGALEVSPDGDTAVMAGRGPSGNRAIIIGGLKSGNPHEIAAVPLPHPTLSFAFSPDGTYLSVGYDFVPDAKITVISGLPNNPTVAYTFNLGVSAASAAVVESQQFSHDGKQLLATVGTYPGGPPPGVIFGQERRLLVLENVHPDSTPVVTGNLLLPDTNPALPPLPQFAGQPTGKALGEAALLCDGDSAIMPVSGVFTPPVSSPDARIFLIKGIKSGNLQIVKTLGPADGVPPELVQVAVAPDCDRAVMNSTGVFAVVSGLSDPTFSNVTVTVTPASNYASGPSEADVTPDNTTLVAVHPRKPFPTPPAAATNWSFASNTLTPIGPVLQGPFRGSVATKDHLVDAFDAGLSDYTALFTSGSTQNLLQLKINLAIKHADHGRYRAASAVLKSYQRRVKRLKQHGALSATQATVLDSLAQVGRDRLPKKQGHGNCGH
ncbi:MAG: hypothetical protein KC503_25145 [Myxococcales bacterium]|nr:hypothetical protein [Myxococcales bacterium]